MPIAYLAFTNKQNSSRASRLQQFIDRKFFRSPWLRNCKGTVGGRRLVLQCGWGLWEGGCGYLSSSCGSDGTVKTAATAAAEFAASLMFSHLWYFVLILLWTNSSCLAAAYSNRTPVSCLFSIDFCFLSQPVLTQSLQLHLRRIAVRISLMHGIQ